MKIKKQIVSRTFSGQAEKSLNPALGIDEFFFSWLLVLNVLKSLFSLSLYMYNRRSCCIKSIFPVAFNIPKMTLPLSYFFHLSGEDQVFNPSSSYSNLTSYQRDNCLRTISKRVDLKLTVSLHAVKSSRINHFNLCLPCRFIISGLFPGCRTVLLADSCTAPSD